MAFLNTAEDVSVLSDAELLARSKREPAIFALLVRRYEAPFLRRARTILGDPEEAKEAVQDAFTKMYLYADRYQEQAGASFASWAYTILNRVAYTRYQGRKRRQKNRLELEPGHLESLQDESARFIDDLSIRSEVLAALAKLPDAAARLLKLQFIEGKSQEEIASAEHLSVPAVKTRVHRAKKLFKKVYDEQRYD